VILSFESRLKFTPTQRNLSKRLRESGADGMSAPARTVVQSVRAILTHAAPKASES